MKIIRKILIFPFIVLIKLYQYLISPWFPLSCRHNPSCSSYSLEAFKKYGLLKGFYLSFRRIVRCNPWGTYGDDPVP